MELDVGELRSIRRVGGSDRVRNADSPVAAVDADAVDAFRSISGIECESLTVRAPGGVVWRGGRPAQVSGYPVVLGSVGARHRQPPVVIIGGHVRDVLP